MGLALAVAAFLWAQGGADFDHLWTTLRDRYAYFAEKATDWDCVRQRRPAAAQAASKRDLVAAIEPALDELYDPHTHLNSNLATSYWPDPPQLVAEWRGSEAIIVAVKQGTPAEAAGVRAGMRVVEVGGVDVAAAVEVRMPKCLARPDPAARHWALVSLLSGRRNQRLVELRVGDGRMLRFEAGFARLNRPAVEVRMPKCLARPDPAARHWALVSLLSGRRNQRLVELRVGDGRMLRFEAGFARLNRPAVEWRRLGDRTGYVRIGTFSDEAVVGKVYDALNELRDCRALIVDVRDNAGGDTAISRPILGRFIRGPASLCADGTARTRGAFEAVDRVCRTGRALDLRREGVRAG